MAKKKWMERLSKLDGAVNEYVNPFISGVDSASPTVNFIFGNTWMIPRGYSAVFFGPPKGGKSYLANSIIGKVHRDDLDACVIKFNTEQREQAQLTKAQMKVHGIDIERYKAYQVNTPDAVFDRIEKDIAAECEDGMPLHLVVIDSVNGIQGRRSLNADSVMVQQIGDHALTIKDGLKRILNVQRKHNFALIVTCHVGAEMDPHEVQRGHKFKMTAAYGLQHHAEYFVCIEKNLTKEGRTDLEGNEFKDENLTDMAGRSEQTAHKIRVTMRDSSLGPKGRVGQFTMDYHRGIINVHEEVFTLGVGRGVIERPNNTTYVFKERKWVGKPAMLEALRTDSDLQIAILKELKARDIAGMLGNDLTGETETAETDTIIEAA
jgi:hypothetical protein